jgi:hypothetical protein
MSQLRHSQEAFLHYLLTGEDSAFLPEIAVAENISAETRARIYGNAYRIRLRETMETDHEMLGIYLGDDLFEEMVKGYVAQHPSRFTSLRDYTVHLPRFMAATPPFSAHPILAEIAAFERLLLDVFDAPDMPRATLEDLRALPAELWPQMRLRFHPSVQMFRAEWNSVESWSAIKHGAQPDPAERTQGLWLLWRGTDRLSQYRPLSLAEPMLLETAWRGGDFSELCEIVAEQPEVDDAATAMLGYFCDWLNNGIIHAVVTEA